MVSSEPRSNASEDRRLCAWACVGVRELWRRVGEGWPPCVRGRRGVCGTSPPPRAPRLPVCAAARLGAGEPPPSHRRVASLLLLSAALPRRQGADWVGVQRNAPPLRRACSAATTRVPNPYPARIQQLLQRWLPEARKMGWTRATQTSARHAFLPGARHRFPCAHARSPFSLGMDGGATPACLPVSVS